MHSYFDEVYDLVSQVPSGSVTTYGQIASLSSRPKAARQVGYALAALSQDHDNNDHVPWYRVVNSRGEISARAKPDYQDHQRILLEQEGVRFNHSGKIDLSSYLWVVEI